MRHAGFKLSEETKRKISEAHKARGGFPQEHIEACRRGKRERHDRITAENERLGGKTCSVCKLFKPFEDFYPDKVGLNGRAPRCKICSRKKAAGWNKAHPERHLAHEWNYKLNSPRKARLRDVRGNLKRYGLTYDQAIAMLETQNYKCAICEIILSLESKFGCQVDHCHKSGQVRSFLCGACNSAIGYLRDNPATAIRAALYLMDHSAKSEAA